MIGMLMALGAAILWGANGIFIHLLEAYGATGAQITAMRFLIVPIAMAIVMWVQDRSQLRIDPRDLGWFALNGMLGMYVFALLYTYAIQRVGMGTAAVLIYLMPVLVSMFGVLFRKEKMTLKKAVVLVMSLVACGLVSGLAGGFVFDTTGVFCGIGAAICYAFYSIVTAERFGSYSSNTSNFYSFLFAAPCAIVYAGVRDGFADTTVFYLRNPMAMVIAMLFGIFCSMISYLLYITAVRKTGVGKASILATFEPVAAALFGFTLFHEQLDGWAVLGIIIEVAALILMVIEPEVKKKKTP